ncbi:hypothetical protein AFCA_004050 [Aspergillus flavus]|nr:hypothetical protein AFCA_004050 [Aspergillus flavus]
MAESNHFRLAAFGPMRVFVCWIQLNNALSSPRPETKVSISYFSFHPFFFSVFILLLPLPFLFLYSTTLLWRGSSYYTHLSKHPSHTTVINSFWTKPSLSS